MSSVHKPPVDSPTRTSGRTTQPPGTSPTSPNVSGQAPSPQRKAATPKTQASSGAASVAPLAPSQARGGGMTSSKADGTRKAKQSHFHCAKCGQVGAEMYCPKSNEILCRQCLGLLHHPRMKCNKELVEMIDLDHTAVKEITNGIMRTVLLFFLGYSVWSFDFGSDYIKGNSVCPILGGLRSAIAKFDVNIFTYCKDTFVEACDVECSYWRLILDFWYRGLLMGSDSPLLLIATVPKAWTFKVVVGKFVGPIFSNLYAVCGVMISILVMKVEDVLHYYEKAYTKTVKQLDTVHQNVVWLYHSPYTLMAKAEKGLSILRTVEDLSYGLFLSTLLSLVLSTFPLSNFTFTSWLMRMATSYRALSEPILWYIISKQCAAFHTFLTKPLRAKGGPAAGPPPTLWRSSIKRREDWKDHFKYLQDRMRRKYNDFKNEGTQILNLLVEQVFNFVVMLRLLDLFLPLHRIFVVFENLWIMRGFIDKHKSWFASETGTQAGHKYLTDNIMAWGVSEITSATKRAGSDLFEQSSRWDFLGVWRFILPAAIWFIRKRMHEDSKEAKSIAKKEWEGKSTEPGSKYAHAELGNGSWKDSAYADFYSVYGSFWNPVTPEEWKPEEGIKNWDKWALSNGHNKVRDDAQLYQRKERSDTSFWKAF